MSFRNPERNVITLLRSLEDRIRRLENTVGRKRQNTIRLGDYVIEALGDGYLQTTNVTTKVKTRVGIPVEIATTQIPVPWSYGQVVTPESDESGPPFRVGVPVVLKRITLELQVASSTDYVINTFVGTNLRNTHTLPAGSTSVTFPLNIPIGESLRFYPQILAEASGDGEDLSITYWYEYE